MNGPTQRQLRLRLMAAVLAQVRASAAPWERDERELAALRWLLVGDEISRGDEAARIVDGVERRIAERERRIAEIEARRRNNDET